MIRRFVIELEDTLKGYDEDVEILERRYGAEERPHGEWIENQVDFVCSNCNHHYLNIWTSFNFCPNCGADNRRADNDKV